MPAEGFFFGGGWGNALPGTCRTRKAGNPCAVVALDERAVLHYGLDMLAQDLPKPLHHLQVVAQTFSRDEVLTPLKALSHHTC